MTEVNDKQVSTDAPAPELPSSQQPTGIQITDLQTILNIIDLASSRGAFRAPELTQVGAIADKSCNRPGRSLGGLGFKLGAQNHRRKIIWRRRPPTPRTSRPRCIA